MIEINMANEDSKNLINTSDNSDKFPQISHFLHGYLRFIPILSIVTILILGLILSFYVSLNKTGGGKSSAAITSTFQPTAPFYATFYYPWFSTPSGGGNWGHWAGDKNQHTPPQNWFSNFLPQYSTQNFDPATRLYSVWDDKLMYWQLQKLAEAKQEVAISSWWGQGDTGDNEFKHIITDVMNRPDNPYPNLRWAIFYEQEGFSDPSVSKIVSDLNYIKNTFANQPGYLKINGQPVIFTYGESAATDGTETTDRWAQAKSQTGFYVLGKVYDGYAKDAAKLNSWYEYATTVYTSPQANYAFSVSPGFWKDGDPVVLPRDLNTFNSSVSQMVSYKAQWKLIETWNEYGEGTGVEPADQVNQTTNGSATLNTGAPAFQNSYVATLNQKLPPLLMGTGGCILTAPSNITPSVNTTAGSKNISWTKSSCNSSNRYLFRVDDLSNPWLGDCGKTQNPGDVCSDNVIGNNYTYNFIQGHTYHIWVQAINSFQVTSETANSNVAVNSAPSVTPSAPSPTPSSANWIFCGNENQTCVFSGAKLVRFGTGSTYIQRTVTGPIPCTRTSFGGDPAPNTVKHCDYYLTSSITPTPTPYITPHPTVSPTSEPTPIPNSFNPSSYYCTYGGATGYSYKNLATGICTNATYTSFYHSPTCATNATNLGKTVPIQPCNYVYYSSINCVGSITGYNQCTQRVVTGN